MGLLYCVRWILWLHWSVFLIATTVKAQRTSASATTRIVGGQNAPIDEYLYHVYLEFFPPDDESYYVGCGGSLIHSDILSLVSVQSNLTARLLV